jgi:biopolymer transport protein ExbB
MRKARCVVTFRILATLAAAAVMMFWLAPSARAESTAFTASSLPQMYAKGGIFMHPLLLCALLSIVLIVERLWTLWHARTDTRHLMIEVMRALRQEGPAAALRVCEGTRGPVANMLHAGLLRAHHGPEAVEKAIHSGGAIEMAFLERRLLALATISKVAALLGFLGAVGGILQAFTAVDAAGQASAGIVANGIEQALIAMAAGLIIAVPVAAFHAYFVIAIDHFVLDMEGSSSELVDELLDLEYRKAGGHTAPSPVVNP